MTFHIESGVLARVAIQPEVRHAAEVGAKLVSLWPLNDAQQLDNDVKYAENLQVRVTRAVAQLLSGENITLADAEFVYEGAESIPGRPDAVVQALLIVNDAYEQMDAYSETGDTTKVMAAAGLLGVQWDQNIVREIAEALESIEAAVGVGIADGARGEVSQDPESVAQRLALIVVALAGLLHIMSNENTEEDSNNDLGCRCTPVLLYVNELCERLSIPRMVLNKDDVQSLLSVLSDEEPHGDEAMACAVASVLAPVAAKEWQKHYDALVFDPIAAKREAKSAEEAQKKAKLAAKFADIPEDPNKKPVEL